MSGYFGKLEEPYVQICKSCAQLDKIISEEQKNKGVIACSAGNHAQGVAFISNQLKIISSGGVK